MARPKLQPASYKGAAFAVTTASDSGGRNTVKHIFPQRETPYVEDLGAAENTFTIEAFVMEKNGQALSALLKALNEPGPGTLVHPWLGELFVSQSAPFKRNYTYQQLGWVGFSLTFTVDSQPDTPSQADHLPSQADTLAASSAGLIDSELDSLVLLSGQGDEILEATLGTAQWCAATVNTILNGSWPDVALLAGQLLGVDVSGFMGLVSKAGGLSGLLGGLFSFGGQAQNKPLAWSQYQQLAALAGNGLKAAPANAGITRQTMASNDQALSVYLGRRALVESARGLANIIPTHQAEAMAMQTTLVQGVDSLLHGFSAGDASGLYPAPAALAASLHDLRALGLKAIAQNSGAAPSLAMVDVFKTSPALLLAWRLLARQNPQIFLLAAMNDIVRRNQISHAGFVPAGKVAVLR